MRSFLTMLLVVLALAYAGACWYLHARQRDLLYYGWATTTPAGTTDFALERPDAVLRGWVVNPDKPDPVLYFGGNAEPIEQNREHFARMFPQRSVYLLAYRGYGASDGQPGEQALVADAVALFDHVAARHRGQRIAVIGRSLGSGVASQLAARRPIDRLALITPFDSMVGVGRTHYPVFPVSWLLDERYESDRALANFNRPVLIIRGGRDTVVPPANTLRLIAALPTPPQALLIETADHNDINNDPRYSSALVDFLQ